MWLTSGRGLDSLSGYCEDSSWPGVGMCGYEGGVCRNDWGHPEENPSAPFMVVRASVFCDSLFSVFCWPPTSLTSLCTPDWHFQVWGCVGLQVTPHQDCTSPGVGGLKAAELEIGSCLSYWIHHHSLVANDRKPPQTSLSQKQNVHGRGRGFCLYRLTSPNHQERQAWNRACPENDWDQGQTPSQLSISVI